MTIDAATYRNEASAHSAVASRVLEPHTLVPVAIVLLLVTLYERIGPSPAVDAVLGAVAAAAAGLMIATTAKIAEPFFRARDRRAIAIAAIGFLAVGIFRWPLLWVLVVLAPVGVAAYWRWRR